MRRLQTMDPRRLSLALALAGGLLLIGCADDRSGSSRTTPKIGAAVVTCEV